VKNFSRRDVLKKISMRTADNKESTIYSLSTEMRVAKSTMKKIMDSLLDNGLIKPLVDDRGTPIKAPRGAIPCVITNLGAEVLHLADYIGEDDRLKDELEKGFPSVVVNVAIAAHIIVWHIKEIPIARVADMVTISDSRKNFLALVDANHASCIVLSD